MDLDEIKDIIDSDGGKIVIVEDGKPTLVVASFAEYKEKLKSQNPRFKIDNNEDNNEDKKLEELTIDDLPV